MVKLRYFSLKWKAFCSVGLALSLIFAGEYLYIRQQLQQTLAQQITELTPTYLDEINLLNRQYRQRLKSLVSSLIDSPDMQAIISGDRQQDLKQAITTIWKSMRLNYHLDGLMVYDHEREAIINTKGNSIPKSLIHIAANDKVEIRCQRTCYLYSKINVLQKGQVVGSIVVSTEVKWFIESFKQHMRVDIGILGGEKNSQYQHYLNRWQSSVLILTDKHNTIKNIAQNINMDDLFDSGTLVKDQDKHYFLSASQIGQSNLNWIFVNDISSIVENNQRQHLRSLLSAVIKLLLSLAFLLLALWRPLTRLKAITQQLPRLASNYESFIQQNSQRGRRLLFADESRVVEFSAMHLAKRLRLLNEKVNRRTQALEDYALQIKQEKQFINTLLNTAQAVIITLDGNGLILMVNHYTQWLTGYSENELTGKHLSELMEGSQRQNIQSILDPVINGEQITANHHCDIRSKLGETIHLAWYHGHLDSNQEHGHSIVSVALDISDRKRVEEHLGWLANMDPLTGLYNRRRFTEEMEQVIAASHRYNHTSGLLFFDLDNFKDVNDLSGHHAGDELLHKVAEVLKNCARESDVVARLGGDEFAVILKETDTQEAISGAQRFCQALNQIEIQIGLNTHRVSASIGIALYPHHGNDLKTLLANADSAMYKAKELGRNRVYLFDESQISEVKIKERVFWNQQAQKLLSDKQVLMFYQPIWHLAENRISHYEALLRIPIADALASPVELIESAERNNLIFDIDLLVIEQVFSDLNKLNELGIDANININISGISFQQENLGEKVDTLLHKYKINATRITCEITETAAVADVAVTTKVMHSLKALGIKLALDDFGVGFSSIYYLKHFPIDYIKIDGSFIKNIHLDKDSQILVKAIAQVADAFSQYTVAEFVEDQAALEKIKSLNITYGQGYYFDPPQPLHEAFKLDSLKL